MAFISDEELYETLFSMEGIKQKFEALEEELNAYLEGLEVMTTSVNPRETFVDLKEKFRSLIPFEDAFILSVDEKNYEVMGDMGGDFKGLSWKESTFFERVVNGESIIVTDAQKINEWQMLPDDLKAKVNSALCVPLIFADKRAIFVLTSSKRAFFTRAYREISKRFALLMTQALINAENLFQIREAQRIASLDMKMAINVQKNVMKRDIPKSDYWEVAYHFQPMAGVSGDIYDFYVNNNPDRQLNGVALYDVSGHGIASGLITMIAKTISFKSFQAYQDQSLGRVMEHIDSEISSEIGGGDFYLTGVLLRLFKDEIEYVNAGHTELLRRSSISEKTSVVNLKDNDIKGFFLGFDQGSESGYRSIKLKIRSGDYLLLYSDCLTETMNAQREQFGLERLIGVMNALPSDSVEENLKFIIQNMQSFSGKTRFNDDITVILLKRK